MIVTIDGPAGAGKSSVAKKLAQRLGFEFLDTGAMYRCVTLKCIDKGVPLDDEDAVEAVVCETSISFHSDKVFCDEKDVTQQIREPRVTESIKKIADNRGVRERLVALQRSWGLGKRGVTEGRDQGSVVFPDAAIKIFLTASAEERAKRRVAQLIRMNQPADFQQILQTQIDRDHDDESRPFGGLVCPPDAIIVSTDGMTEEDVIAKLFEIVIQHQPTQP